MFHKNGAAIKTAAPHRDSIFHFHHLNNRSNLSANVDMLQTITFSGIFHYNTDNATPSFLPVKSELHFQKNFLQRLFALQIPGNKTTNSPQQEAVTLTLSSSSFLLNNLQFRSRRAKQILFPYLKKHFTVDPHFHGSIFLLQNKSIFFRY